MSTLHGPIVPYPRSKAIDRSDVRLAVAWECFADSTPNFVLSGPWMDPASAEVGDLVRRVVGDASQPSLFVLPDAAPATFTRAMLDAAAGDRRVYVLGPTGFGTGQRDPGLRDRASAFVLARRTSLPLLSAVVNCQTRRAVLCIGALATGAARWTIELDEGQSAGFVRVALHWFWHHATDEAWTEPKAPMLTFQPPQERPVDVVPPTDGPVRLLRRPVDPEVVPGNAVCVRSTSVGLPQRARRLITTPSGDGQADLAALVAAGSEVIGLAQLLPDLWVTPSEGMIELPIADFMLRITLNSSQARPLHDALLHATPAAVLRREAPLRTLSGSVWLPNAASAKPCIDEKEIEVGEVPCESLDEVSIKVPGNWPDAPPLVRKAIFAWTNVPPTPPAKAVRSGLYQQWDEADKSLSARIKTCGELLKSAGERSDEARTTLGRWFEGVLGLDRKRRDLVAECESLAAVKLAGRSVDAARGFVARLVTLEAGVQEYAGGVDSDIAKADKQQQREQWDKEQAEHRAQLDEIDAKIAAAKHQKLVLDEEIKSGQRKEESDSDWKARQRRLNDDLKTVASDIARLNVSRSQHEQALKRPFSPKSRHGNDAKKTSSKGFVPAPAKASARLRVPAEALPSVGELFETETERYLAIDTWEQYDLGRAEAARLKARLVARRR
jgi:hypothetical protein